jgi:hypothetical protein
MLEQFGHYLYVAKKLLVSKKHVAVQTQNQQFLVLTSHDIT